MNHETIVREINFLLVLSHCSLLSQNQVGRLKDYPQVATSNGITRLGVLQRKKVVVPKPIVEDPTL